MSCARITASGAIRRLIAGGLMLAVLAAGGDSAQAATTPTCSNKSGTTVRATKHARVFTKRGRVYACLYRVARDRPGRRFVLGNASVRNVRLAGRFVGYSRVLDEGARVTVKELRRGRIVRNARPMTRSPGFPVVTDLVLKRNGSLAWIAGTTPLDLPMAPPGTPVDRRPSFEVHKADTGGRALLDQGREIAPASLRLSRWTASWTKGGLIRSARLD